MASFQSPTSLQIPLDISDEHHAAWQRIVVNNDLEEQADEFYFRPTPPAMHGHQSRQASGS